jgi:hypothetical protein
MDTRYSQGLGGQLLRANRSLLEKVQKEVAVHKGMLTIFTSVTLLIAGSVAVSANQTRANAHQKRIARHHQTVAHPSGDITSFSSSSEGLHIGVNHPPKNR